MYSCAFMSSTKTRSRSPRRTMVAIGGPEPSRICDCHSLRNRSAATYSVRVSVNVPVICRVTIFTPLTEGPGDVSVVKDSSNNIASGIFISFSRPGQEGTLLGPYCTPNRCRAAHFNVKEVVTNGTVAWEVI